LRTPPLVGRVPSSSRSSWAQTGVARWWLPVAVRRQLNKQVSGGLGISEITVKAHQRMVIRKMLAKSLP
jgi:hypothetical protein